MSVIGCCEECRNEPGSVLHTTLSIGVTGKERNRLCLNIFFYLKSSAYSFEEGKIKKKLDDSGEEG